MCTPSRMAAIAQLGSGSRWCPSAALLPASLLSAPFHCPFPCLLLHPLSDSIFMFTYCQWHLNGEHHAHCSSPAYGQYTPAVSLPGSRMAHPWTQPNMDQEHLKKKVLSTLTMYTLFLLVYIKNSWHISHIRFCKCLLFFKDTEVCWICYMLIVQHLYKRLEFLRLWYWGLEPGPQEVKRKDPGMGSIRTKEGYKQFFHTWRSAPSVSLSSDTRREKL